MNKSFFLKLLLLSTILLTGYFRIYKNINNADDIFWDSMVYYCGPHMFNLSGNGYGSLGECYANLIDFKFVYLPIYLRIFNFDFFSPESFQVIWIILLTISIILIGVILVKIYKEFSLINCIILSLFSFSAIPLYGYMSGNISIFLYVFTVFGLYLIISNRKINRTYGLILLTLPSLFKIHMILFLMVAIVLLPKKELKKIPLLILAPFGMIFLNKYLYPADFNLLSENIKILPYVGDMGVGSLQILNYINSEILNIGNSFSAGRHNWRLDINQIATKNFMIDYIVYIIFASIIVFQTYSIKLARLSVDNSIDQKLKLSICMIATFIIIPRLKQYDMILLAIPTLYIVNSAFFKHSIKNSINKLNPDSIIILFNTLIIGFYNFSGDNYFIYPLLLIIYTSCIYEVKKNSM